MPLRIPDKLMRDPALLFPAEAADGLAAVAGFDGAAEPRLPCDFAADRTSVSVTRPSGPVPFTLAKSIPSSAATRRATGEAFTRGSSAEGFVALVGLSLC